MSFEATKRLRARLDELGIEHYDHENGEPLRDLSEVGADPATSWRMDGASVCAVPNKHGTFDLWIDHVTPEQAIAATMGNRTDLARRLREVTGLHAFAELFGFDWADDSDWTWHDVARAMADAIDAATVGRSCASCSEMDNPDSYISHLQSALRWHDEHVPRPTNPLASCVVLQGNKPPEEVLFVAEGGGVTHYLPEDAGTCEWCKDGKTFDRQTVMMTNHGWEKIRHCPNCGRRLKESGR